MVRESAQVKPGPDSITKRLCVVADDYGLHQSVDSAILRLIELGRLQATSCLVGGTNWRSSSRSLSALPAGSADLGLHLDFTEKPLYLPRSGLAGFIGKAYLRLHKTQALLREIRAQLDEFESHLGRAPDYVDGHQHVHQLPQVRDVLLDELDARYGAAHRPWLRSTICAPAMNADPVLPAAERRKARIIEALGAQALGSSASRRRYRMNRGFLGVYGFDRNASDYSSLVRAWLAQAQDGSLMMCHPALAPVPDDPISAARMIEFSVLQSDDFAAWTADAGIDLMPMSAIIDRHRSPDAHHADGGRPAPDSRQTRE